MVPYARRDLRNLSEASLLWLFSVEVERLLRIAQEVPGLVGQVEWTQAALCVGLHVAQFYAELKRRSRAMRARALLREALRQFVAWERSFRSGGDTQRIINL